MYPILLRIGPVRIYSYGVMLALAFSVCLFLALKRCGLFGIRQDIFSNLVLVLLFSGIIGARLLYVFSEIDFFSQNPVEIFMINRGGLVFYGAFIFAPLFGILYAKKSRISVADAADLLAPFIALGHSIGRIGCFLNGCCYGRPTDLMIGVCFPSSHVKVYPVQIFSSIGLFFIFIALSRIQQNRAFKGQVIAWYLILYGLFRFAIEFFRGDLPQLFFGLSLTRIISIAFVLTGLLIIYFSRGHEQSIT
ncbi:MAG: prolipoprotein diacylglyceryl transferase [Candidatus Omnitrophica bacterium]|jgi:phosphatidylglycerol:prolipoprotein diacylglycerol transferase|nr:prolipoprotein diacylglyceryl transferase [Candidatus Omnitrophota bacterium]